MTWRDIPGYPGYQASDDGRIRSIDRVVTQKSRSGRLTIERTLRGVTLAASPDGHGYFKVVVFGPRPNPQRMTRTVHRLVCLAFHGEPPAGRNHAAHRDGDKLNNVPGNLYWATPQENEDDKKRHGRNQGYNMTHCHAGHPFDEHNTYWIKTGGRQCKSCSRKRSRASYQARKKANA